MSTQLFFWGLPASLGGPGMYTGTNTAKLNGVTTGWSPMLLHSARSGTGGLKTSSVTTVAGPTNGVECQDGSFGVPYEWFTLPLSAAVTISGTITLNLWGLENNMSANAAINCRLERVDSTGAVVSQIAKSARITELGTVAAVGNFTVTPTSMNMLKGDRIRATVFFDDAGTMGATFQATFDYDGQTSTADGDSFVTFTETFTFQTTDPSGSSLYLTSVVGPAAGANSELEMWTSRGGSASSAVVNSAAGWTAPIQWTDTAGGTAVEWYSKQLSAFTLDGLVRVNMRAFSTPGCDMGLRASLFVCDSAGSIVSTWGAACIIDAATVGGAAATAFNGYIDTTQARVRGWLAGSATAITAGQRLMLRVYADDMATGVAVAGSTMTLKYNGPTLDADGDSYITLPQSVTEYVAPGPSVPPLPAQRSRRWQAMRGR